jgi:hypothetical protein
VTCNDLRRLLVPIPDVRGAPAPIAWNLAAIQKFLFVPVVESRPSEAKETSEFAKCYVRMQDRWPDPPSWEAQILAKPSHAGELNTMASIPGPTGNAVTLRRKLAPIETTIGTQRRLNHTGFGAVRAIDGIVGPITRAALLHFYWILGVRCALEVFRDTCCCRRMGL